MVGIFPMTMIDIICAMLLYYIYMLNLFGVEMIFIFKVIMTVCIIKLIITVIKSIKGIEGHKEEMTVFWRKYFQITAIVGSSVVCLMLTAFSSWKIKLIFLMFFFVIMLVTFLLKTSHFKAMLLILISSTYGIILAKWYQVNPLEGRFGDNGFLDSLGIVLSAIFLLLPIYILTSNQVKSEE